MNSTHSPSSAGLDPSQNYKSYGENRASTPIIDFEFKTSWGEALFSAWQSLKANIRHSYLSTTDKYFDELIIRISEEEINSALHRFVTQNVEMVQDLHLDLHDDWLRLYATVYFKGIFASVATNLRLVGVSLNAENQRFVFEQISDTEILQLHSKNWLHAFAAKNALKLYHGLFKKDPLAPILNAIKVKDEPFAVYKGNYIYLDIHRYLAKQKKILSYLAKAQVNDGKTLEHNLLFKVQINFAELINFGVSGEDIISEKDNPNQTQDQ